MWSLVVDVGCGNGKYMRVKNREDLSFFGCDRSAGLLNICREKSLQALQVDCLALPFREEAFDAVICIAVVHHLSTSSRRKQAIHEMLKLLKRNGRLLISVWALDQGFQGSSKYLKEGRTTNARHTCVRAGSTEVRTYGSGPRVYLLVTSAIDVSFNSQTQVPFMQISAPYEF